MSASMMSTWAPVWERAMAVLIAVVVFPSAGLGLVMAILFGRLLGEGEKDGGPDIPIGLGEHRFGMAEGDQLDRIGGLRLQSPSPLIGDLRNHSEGGKPNQLLHVLRRLHRVVKVLEEEGKSHPEEEADHSGQKKVQSLIGFVRSDRELGLVDHLDVAGRDAG